MRPYLLALALIGSGSLSQAQVPVATRPIQLVVSGGLQLPTGGFGDFHQMGAHADASLVINAFGGMRLRPELSYARFKVKEALTALSSRTSALGAAGGAAGARADLTTDAVSSLMGGFANIELPLGPAGFQPFVLAGLGAVSVKTDASTAAEALSEVKASVNLGAGIRFRLGKLGGLIEARMNNVPTNDTKAYFKGVRTIPVTFGLVF